MLKTHFFKLKQFFLFLECHLNILNFLSNSHILKIFNGIHLFNLIISMIFIPLIFFKIKNRKL